MGRKWKSGKEYLDWVSDRIDFLTERINDFLVELTEERDRLCSIGAISNDERVQTSKEFDKFSLAQARLEELEKRIDSLDSTLYYTKKNAIAMIEKMNDVEQVDILLDLYIYNKPNNQIAKANGVSERTVQRKHKEAIDQFNQFFSNLSQ